MKFTNVSIKADREYVRRLHMLALSNGKTIGELVREAVDACYVQQMEVFFQQDVAQTEQSIESINTIERN